MVGYLINKVDCLHRLEVDILRRRARATIASTPSFQGIYEGARH